MKLVDELKKMLESSTVVNKNLKPLIPQIIVKEPGACVIISFLNGLIHLDLLNVRQGNDLLRDEEVFKKLKMEGTDYVRLIINDLPKTGHAKRVKSNTVEWDYKGRKAVIKHFLLRKNNDEDISNLKGSLKLLAANKGAIVFQIRDKPKHAGLAYGIHYKHKDKVLVFDPIKGYQKEELKDFVNKLKDLGGYLLIKEKT